MTRRLAFVAYGIASYVMFLGVFLYAIGFLGGFLVPRTLDGAPRVSLIAALGIDLALLAAFAIQHSVMARPAFKSWWTRYVPQEIERSTYVLFSNVAMIALFWFWEPLGGVVWSFESSLARNSAWAAYGLGWTILLISTFLINHFDLFGLRQVWYAFRQQETPPLAFQVHSAYRFVRHPIYVGWVMLFWAAPTMTTTRLLFAVMTTAYILIAVQFEERDLVAEHGQSYLDYQKRVPMLVPRLSDPGPELDELASPAV